MDDRADQARFPRVVLGTICIPWTTRHELDVELLHETVASHAGLGIRDLYVFGTAGEGYAVDEARFDAVVTAFVDATARLGIEPMVGVISLSTMTVLDRIERAMAAGVRRFQVSLPSWGTLVDGEVRTWADTLFGRFPAAWFVQYDLRRTGRLMEPAAYAAIAADHPNLVATKNGTWDVLRILALHREAPMLRHFLTEMGYPFGCAVGRPGLLMSLSGANPAAGIRFFEAGLRGDLGELLARQGELVAIEAALERAAGDSGAHMDGAFERMLHRLVDERFPMAQLPPYAAVPEAGYRAFRDWLAATHPRWLPEAG
jgi:dihydrodipicolinate synthase/N-acetylneuraminate lyase